MDDTSHIWLNRDDNRNVAYLNRNGSERNLNLNWYDNEWNDNCRFLAVRNSFRFSEQLFARFYLITCFIQPPNILPISLKGSDMLIYFLLSKNLISQDIFRKNFSRSNLLKAFCKNGNFCSRL